MILIPKTKKNLIGIFLVAPFFIDEIDTQGGGQLAFHVCAMARISRATIYASRGQKNKSSNGLKNPKP